MADRLEYLEHFLDSVDYVISGRKGSISDDRWLQSNYDPSFYGVLEKQLKNTDERVRSETIMLLSFLKERAAMGAVKEMRRKDKERVTAACLSYLSSMDEDDDMVTELFEILEYKRGNDFRNAAVRIGNIGRDSDIPRMRRIYGQVDGDMRMQMKDALTKVIERYPELGQKKDLLLSVPVFPDENGFDKFLGTARDYMDVRYRNGIHSKRMISMDTYNNIVRGLRRIRTRLYNESDNLTHYSADMTDRYNEAVDLLAWSTGDLLKKEVTESSEDMTCPRCGNAMMKSGDSRRCIDCGLIR